MWIPRSPNVSPYRTRSPGLSQHSSYHRPGHNDRRLSSLDIGGGVVTSRPLTPHSGYGAVDNASPLRMRLLDLGAGADVECEVGASAGQTFFAIVKIFAGLGLLSQPFALLCSGWFGFALIGIVSLWAGYAGWCFVWVAEELKHRHYNEPCGNGIDDAPLPVSFTYTEMVSQLLPRPLATAAKVAVFGEYCSAIMVVLVFLWRHVLILVPVDPLYVSVGTSVALLPLICADSLHGLTLANVVGVLANVLIVVELLYMCSHADWEGHLSPQPAVGDRLSAAVGIVVLAFGGLPALPRLMEDMSDEARPHFGAVWNGACVTIGGLYSLVAILGVGTFGAATLIIVTGNMRSYAAAVLVAINTATTIAPLVLVASEIPLDFLDNAVKPSHTVFIRLLIYGCCVTGAGILSNYLLVLETIGGMLLGLTSLVLPVALWMICAWSARGLWWRVTMSLLMCVLLFGYGLSLAGLNPESD
eukprot:TRINITY_DN16511_c0_g1_i1.p1 TRINITY_DN16511_c0_g1~~TRINITY_DN16511_c0_g1_i1.p1  ORF type:complete len:472 (+),score=80.56 TRINITY_DN16511_c0_g1_i1:62-1477(+)